MSIKCLPIYRRGRRLSRLTTKGGKRGEEDGGSSLLTMDALCYRCIMHNARGIAILRRSACTKYRGSAFVARAVKMPRRPRLGMEKTKASKTTRVTVKEENMKMCDCHAKTYKVSLFSLMRYLNIRY